MIGRRRDFERAPELVNQISQEVDIRIKNYDSVVSAIEMGVFTKHFLVSRQINKFKIVNFDALPQDIWHSVRAEKFLFTSDEIEILRRCEVPVDAWRDGTEPEGPPRIWPAFYHEKKSNEIYGKIEDVSEHPTE